MDLLLYLLACEGLILSYGSHIVDAHYNALQSNHELHPKVSMDLYLDLLMKTSMNELLNMQKNIRTNYNLTKNDGKLIGDAFQDSDGEYEDILQTNLKTIVQRKILNTTTNFLLYFTDVSNSILTSILEYKLGLAEVNLNRPMKWYKETLKQKIVRQQSKISSNNIIYIMCKRLSICKRKTMYAEYLVDWIRHVSYANGKRFKEFFYTVPKVLEFHEDFLRCNSAFKITLGYLENSKEIVQKDTLDFVDEVITKGAVVFELVPTGLKQIVADLNDLFILLDDRYDLDSSNVNDLNKITNLIVDWRDGRANILQVLELILDNMKKNLDGFTVDTRNKISNIWDKVTAN